VLDPVVAEGDVVVEPEEGSLAEGLVTSVEPGLVDTVPGEVELVPGEVELVPGEVELVPGEVELVPGKVDSLPLPKFPPGLDEFG
jgi:hypothetical protein